ncbi:hypothetical protein VP01_15348g1, partial [Puccinia sorghi]
GGRLCIPICSPEVPGWEMAPPRRLIDKCSHSIQLEEYSDHDKKIQTTGRIEELDSMNQGKDDMEDSNTPIIDLMPFEEHEDIRRHTWEEESEIIPELQEGFMDTSWAFQDEEEASR